MVHSIRLLTVSLVLATLSMPLTAAESDAKKPPKPKELKAAPTEVTIGQQTIRLKATLIRNRMPMIGPAAGSRDYFVLRLSTDDKAAFPADAKFTDVYAVQGENVWKAKKLEGPRGGQKGMVELVARDVPPFAGRGEINVVVQLTTAEKAKLAIRGIAKPMEVH